MDSARQMRWRDNELDGKEMVAGRRDDDGGKFMRTFEATRDSFVPFKPRAPLNCTPPTVITRLHMPGRISGVEIGTHLFECEILQITLA
jgi:hypothetical protein